MKLTEKLLKEQVAKTLKEYLGDDVPSQASIDYEYEKQGQERDREAARKKKKYQSADASKHELYMQGKEDAQTIVKHGGARGTNYKPPQMTGSPDYMKGYMDGQAKLKADKERDRENQRKTDDARDERKLKALGLDKPSNSVMDIWMSLYYGGPETEDLPNSMFRGGWINVMKAKHGKRWTRTKPGDLAEMWENSLKRPWENRQIQFKKHDLFGLGNVLRAMGAKAKGGLKKKDRDFWYSELDNHATSVANDLFKQHKSGMMGKAASFFGFEESITLSSDDIRSIIQEELINISKGK